MKKRYRILSSNGIDEKLYVNINGHNQYVFIRGKDVNNPIILNLHGGPANPDAFFTYEFAKEIIDESEEGRNYPNFIAFRYISSQI